MFETAASIIDLEPLDTGDLISALGFGAAAVGLWFTGRQLRSSAEQSRDTRRTRQARALLDLAPSFREYDALQRQLAEPEWEPDAADQVVIRQYMGLFEAAEQLLQADVLEITTFERLYGYRLRVLVASGSVRKRFDDGNYRSAWVDFIELWRRLDEAYRARTGRTPEHTAPVLP